MTAPDGGEDAGRAGASADDPGDASEVRLSVPDMDCASCAEKVEGSVRRLDGIETVDPQAATGRLTVRYDDALTDAAAVRDRVERAGYEVADEAGAIDGDAVWTSSRALRTWAGAVAVVVGLALEFPLSGSNAAVASVLGSELLVADVLFLAATAVAGGAILRNGYRSLWARTLDIDLLMSIAVLGAVTASLGFGASLYFEAATLAVLFSVAELLEEYSIDRARQSLQELLELSPDEATVLRDGEAVTVPVDDLAVGEVVAVRPGEQIPADGVVVEGESAVDQAPVTGESVPVDKRPGDEVFAGTVNQTGYVEVEVTAAAGADTLSRIVTLVEDAQSNRTDREQFVERFANYYTPVVVGLALLTAVGPPLLIDGTLTVGAAGYAHTFVGGWETWFVRGLTLVVLACPCAFVISTPVSVVSGVTSAANHGVLIKGGDRLEAMGSVGAVALDKTGTVTTGELRVTDVVPLGGNSEADVLRCARGLESRSEHPVGDAIVDHADERAVAEREVDAFESLTGRGVQAELDGTQHYAGTPGLFEELGFDLSHVHATTDGGVVTRTAQDLCERNNCLDLLSDTVPRLQGEGKTVVLVGTEAEIEGVIAVADEVRPEARRAVEQLHELGVDHVAMLTGDNERTARAVASEVGVDDVRAELLPEEKVEAVRELDETYDGVAMVGDGVNDAPALATATVGVAMGAAGTDTAIETADVALLSDDLSRLPYLYDLAARADGVIRQNIWASLGAKAALAAGVPFGLVPIWLAVLAGDAGMTVGVTGNAMRLSRVRPESAPGAHAGHDHDHSHGHDHDHDHEAAETPESAAADD